MNNSVKIVVGSIIGSGVAAAVSKVLERQTGIDTAEGVVQTAEGKKESLRDRWERAKRAGEAARVAREAELRAYFRVKVNDPDALRTHPDLGEQPAIPPATPVIVEPGAG